MKTNCISRGRHDYQDYCFSGNSKRTTCLSCLPAVPVAGLSASGGLILSKEVWCCSSSVFAQDVTRSGAHDAEASGAAGRTEISEDKLAWLLKYGTQTPILSESVMICVPYRCVLCVLRAPARHCSRAGVAGGSVVNC